MIRTDPAATRPHAIGLQLDEVTNMVEQSVVVSGIIASETGWRSAPWCPLELIRVEHVSRAQFQRQVPPELNRLDDDDLRGALEFVAWSADRPTGPAPKITTSVPILRGRSSLPCQTQHRRRR